MKIGANIICARTSGTTTNFDEINKFFSIYGMSFVSSNYWNNIHGRDIGETIYDKKGLQTAWILVQNIILI